MDYILIISLIINIHVFCSAQDYPDQLEDWHTCHITPIGCHLLDREPSHDSEIFMDEEVAYLYLYMYITLYSYFYYYFIFDLEDIPIWSIVLNHCDLILGLLFPRPQLRYQSVQKISFGLLVFFLSQLKINCCTLK